MWNSDSFYLFASIIILTLATLFSRSIYALFAHKIQIPPRVYHALQFAPIAALAGIIIPHLAPWVTEQGPVFDIRLVAAIVAGLIFLKYRQLVLLIGSGMIALWALQWLVDYSLIK